MKIAHVSATFPPYYAGTGNVCFHNARLLAERGHSVDVFTARLDGTDTMAEQTLFRIHRLPYWFRIGNAFVLPGLLQLRQFDLVHLHYPFIFGSEFLLLNRTLNQQQYVLTYHNDLLSPGIKGIAFRLYQAMCASYVLRGAARIMTTAWDFAMSSPLLSRVVASAPGRIVEVPNGVDCLKFNPGHHRTDGHLLRNREGPSPKTCLFVGAMDTTHHHKSGVPNLLNAMSALRARDDLRLVLVGGGDMVPSYLASCKVLGIAQSVEFTGWIPHEQMPAYYASADVVIQPSVTFEPFGMVAVEAMSCGVPVIASNLPGVRSVVSDGVDGFLVPPGDVDALSRTITHMLELPASRRIEMGQAGRSKVKAKYDWERVGDQLEAVYREVLGKRVA